MNQEIYALVGYLCASDGWFGVVWYYGVGFALVGLAAGVWIGRRTMRRR